MGVLRIVRLAFVLLLWLSPLAMAQLPSARLRSIFPPAGQTGGSIEVMVSGQDLDDATAIHFSHPGISSRSVADGIPTEHKFIITIAPDVPRGVYEARVIGRYGISNPRAFLVGREQEAQPPKENISADKAAALAVNLAVSSRCIAGAADYYTVELKRDQHVLVECSARQIDSRMNPVLLLYAPDGRELDRSRRGGLLDITAPEAGRYTLKVHDLLFGGGPERFYRLAVTTAPHLDCIFPPVGQGGSKARYTLYGRNLPGGSRSEYPGPDGKPLEQLDAEIQLPVDPTNGSIEYRLRGDSGESNPVSLALARDPVVVEQGSNGKPSAARKVAVPCEVAGRFYPRDDQRWIAFDAKKGESYWIEIFADRLAPPAAPYLLLQRVTSDDQGSERAEDVREVNGVEVPAGASPLPDLAGATRDVIFRFDAKESGAYRLLVRDLFNSGQEDGTRVYRLSIRRASPDFRLVAAPLVLDPKSENSTSGILLRRGGAAPIRVAIARVDGFEGEVQIDAEGLPWGVGGTTTIAAGQDRAVLMLAAHDDAASWAGPIHIVGRARIGARELAREALCQAVMWPGTDDEPAWSRSTGDLAVGVSDELAPLTIDIGDDRIVAAREGDVVGLRARLIRHAQIKSPVKIKLAGLPQLDKAAETTIEPSADEGTVELNLAQHNLSPGVYSFYLQAGAHVMYEPGVKKGNNGGGGREIQETLYSPSIVLRVLPATHK